MDAADALRDFVAKTLELWDIDGTIEACEAPAVTLIRTAGGALVWVDRAEAGVPFRWFVRSRAAGEPPGGPRERRPRACASLVGVLSAMRMALGVERGSGMRVAAAAAGEGVPPSTSALAAYAQGERVVNPFALTSKDEQLKIPV